MMAGSWLNGGLILIAGIALIIFILAKLIPRTNHDKDMVVLLGIFLLVGIGLVGMGGYIGMGSWVSAMSCW